MIVYEITSPTGKVYPNISNLKEFCEEYSLNYKGIKKRSYNENGIKKYAGWCFERIGQVEKLEYDSQSGIVKRIDSISIRNDILKNVLKDSIPNDKYDITADGGDIIIKKKDSPSSEIPKEKNEEFEKYSNYGLSSDELLQKAINENALLKKKVKELTVENSLSKIVSGVIKETVEAIDIPKKNFTSCNNNLNINSSKIEEEAILLLSDFHSDSVVSAESTTYLERYDFNVCSNRAEVLIDSTIKFIKKTLSNYNYRTLNLMCLGDMISGSIHGATLHNQFRNSIKGAMATGELISLMILDLAPHFEKIKFYGIQGNHGKFDNHKDYRSPQLNWDYLVYSYAVSRLQKLVDDGRLEYIIPNSWSYIATILGHRFHLSHGDDIRGSGNYYGISKRASRINSLYSGFVENNIDYYLLGHFHRHSEIQEQNSRLIMNSSAIATDQFSLNALSVCSTPTQLLMSVSERYGLTWRLPIQLRPQSDNWMELEKKKSRYSVNIMSD